MTTTKTMIITVVDLTCSLLLFHRLAARGRKNDSGQITTNEMP